MSNTYFPLILVIDDDPIIRRTLSLNLQQDGFDVVTAASGAEALEIARKRLPDLALVDLMLPDLHGFEVSRRLKQYVDLPIVMLTAVGTEESIIQGLREYAEDYVVKPFSYGQLVARITRVLKRSRSAMPETEVVRLDEQTAIDFARHELVRGTQRERLAPTESRALACLVRHRNQVVSIDTLLDEVWPDGEGDPARLWVLINRLRHKLEPTPREPRYLLNERSVGYRLVIS